jgi:hypothetical protein
VILVNPLLDNPHGRIVNDFQMFALKKSKPILSNVVCNSMFDAMTLSKDDYYLKNASED